MSKSIPNNYPAEGDHSPVTAAGVRAFEHHRYHRIRAHEMMEYFTGEVEVRTTREAAMTYTANLGHKILQQASSQFGDDMEGASRRPLAIDFDQVSKEAQEHIERRGLSKDRDQSQDI